MFKKILNWFNKSKTNKETTKTLNWSGDIFARTIRNYKFDKEDDSYQKYLFYAINQIPDHLKTKDSLIELKDYIPKLVHLVDIKTDPFEIADSIKLFVENFESKIKLSLMLKIDDTFCNEENIKEFMSDKGKEGFESTSTCDLSLLEQHYIIPKDVEHFENISEYLINKS
jgi:hypothetical protein